MTASLAVLLTLAAAVPEATAECPAGDAPGLCILRDVHAHTRFRTLTFTQKTTFPDGRVEWRRCGAAT